MKSVRHLKQCILYLIAYFMLQESERLTLLFDDARADEISLAFGTYFSGESREVDSQLYNLHDRSSSPGYPSK